MMTQGRHENTFLTVDAAAAEAGLSHWTIRSWLRKGLLTHYKSGSRTVINREELIEWLILRPQDAIKHLPPGK